MKKRHSLIIYILLLTLLSGFMLIIIFPTTYSTKTTMNELTSQVLPTDTITTPAQIPTITPTLAPTVTPTPVPTITATPIPTATNTPVPTVTATPIPTATATPVPTATSTPVPTATPTPILTVRAQSIQDLFSSALLPVGSTMYIWGGGWNKEDTGAGPGATIIGTSPQWKQFASLQDETYTEKKHRYEIENGLDCSGYVGWVIYNLFEQEPNKPGYVFKSSTVASEYSKKGWGDCLKNPDTFLPGDIVSMIGHVWISLGMCDDGSVVVLHSSPPGVSICGTKLADGSDSEAIQLAKQYMELYFPEWQQKYPDRSVDYSYIENVSVLRWNATTLFDAPFYQSLDAKTVLEIICQ